MGTRGEEAERVGEAGLYGAEYAMWVSLNVRLLVVIAVMKQGGGWWRTIRLQVLSPAGPREHQQMSPEVQEIEWIL